MGLLGKAEQALRKCWCPQLGSYLGFQVPLWPGKAGVFTKVLGQDMVMRGGHFFYVSINRVFFFTDFYMHLCLIKTI